MQPRYQQTISVNTLFHFTKGIRRVYDILAKGYRANYCSERVPLQFFERTEQLAIPMVCFCDLPLSLIKNHIRRYGGFGMGLDKEWGFDNGISSISYIQPNAITKRKLEETLQFLSAYEKSKMQRQITDQQINWIGA